MFGISSMPSVEPIRSFKIINIRVWYRNDGHSPGTNYTHLSNIYHKLDVNSTNVNY